eukprot:CAMPEP_0185590592 /NCGR_PEP_ID=MMETSP0434-20130131/61317_1 /TAXON_ID=626734 ORGANISM="Favella taraikaensis, Strain Fe Narragansett Bay" /NCGR_SAMPLE_ID=MMETSP0434 /ASSEMBLY_ACC=CAM_ASM_000379 /LENGTH=110 /DNA_ID=CAMNT_0028214901 /DNA_START=672 /DNA_END=1004 /DNA_ORIENTATION=-
MSVDAENRHTLVPDELLGLEESVVAAHRHDQVNPIAELAPRLLALAVQHVLRQNHDLLAHALGDVDEAIHDTVVGNVRLRQGASVHFVRVGPHQHPLPFESDQARNLVHD